MAFNKVTTFVGGAGTGKTTELQRLIHLYTQKGMKVLIYDDFNHPSYRHIPQITIKQLPYWESGVYRLIHPDSKEAFTAISLHCWNTLVVLEDCFKYVGQKFTKPMIKFIIDAKQHNCDFVFMYHCWAWVALDMARRCDAYVIFKTNDTPASRFNKKDAPYLDELMVEYLAVMADKNDFKKKLFKTKLNG
ncbi:MAG: hypothetical protein Q7W13_14050 [Bacteroidia bacterium]|nr:hypothetical protein [Bacteroidia bacterium]